MRAGFLTGAVSGLVAGTLVLATASLMLPDPGSDAGPVLPAPVGKDAGPVPPGPSPVATAPDVARTAPTATAAAAGPTVPRPGDAPDIPRASGFGRPPEDATPAAPAPEPAFAPNAAAPGRAVDPVPNDPGLAPAASVAGGMPPAVARVGALSRSPAPGADPVRPAPQRDAGPVATILGPQPTEPAEPSPRVVTPTVADRRVALVPGHEVVDAPRAEAMVEVEPVADPVPPRRIVLDSARPAEADTGADADVMAARRGALERNAVPFANPEGRPLLSIMLLDQALGPDVGLDPEAFAGSALTIAIDPASPTASARADAWQAAGMEIVLLAGAATPNATPQDIEIAVEGARGIVPQAVGLADIGPDPAPDMASVAPALAQAGLGYLGRHGGLGAEVAAARRAGVPAVTLSRSLGPDDASAEDLLRSLDRAAFDAVRSGATVVTGPSTEAMREALRRWAESDRAGEVATAPLSAILLGVGSDG